MANFCILRTKKLKTNANVGASVSHCLRTRETPNADPELTKYNWTNVKGSAEDVQKIAMARYKKKLPEKVRKNGVRAVELMMTASPEAFQKMQPNEYLNTCDKWAKEKFGKENIFLIAHHYDEKTPHTSIFLVPTDDKGKLNCRHFLGGKEKMIELQDSFYKHVHEKFQHLERGERGSKAQHQSIRTWYGKTERLAQAIQPPKKELFESQENYLERYKDQIKPHVLAAAENATAKKELPKIKADLKLEKARTESKKIYIKNLENDLKYQIKKTDKSDKEIDNIISRVNRTAEILNPKDKQNFIDEWNRQKALERTPKKSRKYDGWER